jgi:hypothetical protein
LSSPAVNIAPPSPSLDPNSSNSGIILRLTPALLWGSVWALTALLLALYAFKRLFPGDLTDGDAMDYAQIARNITNGHGYATSILRPLALSGFVSPDPHAGYTTPDISRPPLYPFLLMLAFVAHGGHGGGNMVVLTSLLFFLASTAGVYFLAWTVLPAEGRPWTLLLAMGLYILSGTALGFATAGSPVPLMALVLSLFLAALFRSYEASGRLVSTWQVAGVGMLLGLCYLGQYSLLLLLPTTLVYIFASRAPARAWTGVGACTLGFLVVTLPWLYRTAQVTHAGPFFTLLDYGIMTGTMEYPGQSSVYRGVLPVDTPFTFFFPHLLEMLKKAGLGMAYYQAHLSEAFPILVLVPALASLAWRFSDIRVGVLRTYLAISLFLLAFASAFFTPAMSILAPFAPALIVLGVGFVCQLMLRQQWRVFSQRLVLWGWGGLMGLGLVCALDGHSGQTINPIQNGIRALVQPPLQPSLPPVSAEYLRRGIAQGAVITDTPWEVAWRSQLPAIWLPRDNQAYEAVIRDRTGSGGKVPAMCLLLTPNIAAYSAPGEAGPWIALARDPQALAHRALNMRNTGRLKTVLNARIALAQKLIDSHDPSFAMTQDELDRQVAQVNAALPTALKNARAKVQAQYDDTYGPISEVIADYHYDPRLLPQQQEPTGAPSTVFLRNDLWKSLTTPSGATP